MGTSAALGGAAGLAGGNGWQHKQSLGLTVASLSGNGLNYGLSVAGATNLRNVVIPALVFGSLGGYYGLLGKHFNPTGNFVGF